MASGVLAEIVLPLCIVVIMITMGMALSPDDFRRVASSPRQIGVGLFCQMILLPIIGFAVAAAFPLEAVFAVSLVLLAATPGGTTSNLIVHAAEGDRALSVSLTALSNSIVWLTLPFLLGLAFELFGDDLGAVDVPLIDLMIQVAGLTVLPVLIGMGVRRRRPDFCERVKSSSKIFASAFLGIVVLALVVQNIDDIIDDGPRFAPAFIVMNLVALAAGYTVANLAGIDRAQSMTIAIETGLQNATLAIALALTVLDNEDMAIIPGLYGVWMLLTGFGFAFYMTRDERRAAVTPAT